MSVATTETWKNELILITDLVAANKLISMYVLHALDADAGREDPTRPATEHALGTRLTELGDQLQTRATQRSANTQGRLEPDRGPGTGELPHQPTTKHRQPSQKPPWTNENTAIYES